MKHAIVALSILVGLVACKGTEKSNNHEVAQDTTSAEITDELTPEPLENLLVLNNGDKWEVNEATYEATNNMCVMVDKFTGDDYIGLGDSLMTQISYMLAHCDMKGEGHNNLHVWLIPTIEEVNLMQSGESENLATIRSLLATYGDFFHYTGPVEVITR